MATLKDRLAQRANVWSQMQEIRTSVDKDGWTPELRESWDRADTELTELSADIERDQRDGDLEKRFAAIDEDTIVLNGAGERGNASDAGKYRKAFERFMRFGMNELEVEERQLLQRNQVDSKDDPQLRALGASTGSAGGYTVPEGFWAKVTETLKMFGGAMDGAEMVFTDSGAPLPWPTNDDTANVGYILGENVSGTNEGDLSFGQKSLGAYTFVSGPALVSFQLLQDSGIDIEAFAARKMGERIGRIQNTRFTTGTGSSQPQGYITGATTGVTTASATAITYDEIIDLIHSVDAAYRASGRCQFKLHDLVLAKVRKLRDDSGGAGLGRPLWEPSTQVGQPDTLLGYAVKVNNDQDSTVAATKKTMAFGDFQSAFAVRKVNGGSLLRLTERYADALQVGFIGFERADSLVQDSGAVKLLVQHS